MKKIFLICSLILWISGMGLKAQTKLEYQKYWIEFTDKNNSPYSLNNPEAFLSEKALWRRLQYNIPIEENDLPVDPAYLKELRDKGLTILYTSRWFNAALVIIEDKETLNDIKTLNFIKNTEVAAKRKAPVFDKQNPETAGKKEAEQMEFYGYGFKQLHFGNGHYLHQFGYQGNGMSIAVIDAGFAGVDTISAFRKLKENGQIKGGYDFVDGTDKVFLSDENQHGTYIFSVMGAAMDNIMIGTAPKADYWFFRTEAANEYRIEEFNWIAAAEFADSVGVDVINTSLGYNIFDLPEMSYDYFDLDGQSTFISKGANIAAQKGMLLINSAGNEGNTSWKYILAPADCEQVLTVGSVDANGYHVSGSSIGPTADGRIKPDVVMLGKDIAHVNRHSEVKTGGGTSFAAPIITGLAACLWSANRNLNNQEIIDIIRQSSNQSTSPDNTFGYGIPDFFKALKMVNPDEANFDFPITNDDYILVHPNPFEENTNVYYYSELDKTILISVYDAMGHLMNTYQTPVQSHTHHFYRLEDLKNYPKGIYFIRIDMENINLSHSVKAVKIRD